MAYTPDASEHTGRRDKGKQVKFRLGIIINPMAGIGGPVGLKGSDGADIVAEALSRGAQQRAGARAVVALQAIIDLAHRVEIYCCDGPMGGDALRALGMKFHCIGHPSGITTPEDTIDTARALAAQGVDLILFAGGDGTARDMVAAIGDSVPVLGIPAGVKMHSGVYAVSPEAAGEILVRLVEGRLVDIGLQEVRDIDEEAFREGRVRTRFYGELRVPRVGRFLQQVKSSGREVEELVVQDIGADLVEAMEPGCLYLIGPGSTPSGFMEELGLENSLLGVDAVCDGGLLGHDLNEQQILALLDRFDSARIVVTIIGGQGHLFGRGNQQLSARVIRRVGLDNIIIVSSKSKLTELGGRPLLLDTGDAELDRELAGYRQVITGYHDAVIYPLGLETSSSE